MCNLFFSHGLTDSEHVSLLNSDKWGGKHIKKRVQSMTASQKEK